MSAIITDGNPLAELAAESFGPAYAGHASASFRAVLSSLSRLKSHIDQAVMALSAAKNHGGMDSYSAREVSRAFVAVGSASNALDSLGSALRGG